MTGLDQDPYNKKERFINSHIELKSSLIHRYGVFASKDIAPEEIIEECPLIIFKSSTNIPVEVWNKEFDWDDENNAIALGYGSFYNHSDQPNAMYTHDYKNNTLRFTATKPIFAGTEIFVNYGDEWFTSRGAKSISLEDQEKRNNFGIYKLLVVFFILLVLSQIFPVNWAKVNKSARNTNKIVKMASNNYIYNNLAPNELVTRKPVARTWWPQALACV